MLKRAEIGLRLPSLAPFIPVSKCEISGEILRVLTWAAVASTFATFCDKFSNACSGTVPPESVTSEPPNTTAPPDSLPTSGDDDDGSNAQDNGNDSSGSGTVTVTVPGSGSVIRAGCAAGLAAVVGAVLLL